MPFASFFTLGCRLNQTESAIMAKSLEALDYVITENKTNSDVCVINTCTVTNQSDSKCRQAIRSIRKNNPTAILAVVGCFSQISSKIIKEIGGVDIVLGNEEKLNLKHYLEIFLKDSRPIIAVGSISKNAFTIDTIGQHLGSTRANLKVQDGCDFVCSYCIIPKARGRSRSREVDNIKQEARQLAAIGVKEIILTGVNIGTYQYLDYDIIKLLDIFESISGIQRVRISSIEPTTIGKDVFELMKNPDHKLVPYLHLPLQSGSNAILKAMRRRYEIQKFEDYVLSAADQVPDICIGSDVIVGFPGETDALFEETLNILEKLPIHYFHVFPYAERAGTKSVCLPEKINSKTANRRASVLRILSDQKRTRFAEEFVGRELEVLFEGSNKGNIWKGYTGNYIRVSAESQLSLKNEIRLVKIISAENGQAQGKLVIKSDFDHMGS
ncbi:MAG: tRNA (N(6)-L-threonylcarbamoyladenosine(37)-C(2))-methylthiotransferase MtaB [Deltaproteobacteria bacterium]|jgi:threonylcarbamoyladenosine tRNA methylthiotransferase MtaB|nr:tRNA (N(6)-L-threonylcarbamoyladenosine(37)-C(2))-methylthiotransferase MtaB [Deltaproteobacteria bacterium]MBT4526601.1 tRNA (N(6)-L-threonylcarbamoyladenosine(37)-C(2))-methylthiotransferase MtaB [Deltaproteobacteria bacterium]